jgi:Uncharacterised nucleotidyltransferase
MLTSSARRPAPTQAERQIILIAAGSGARRDAMGKRCRDLMTAVDWSRLTETLRQRKLLTVLGPRLVELAEGTSNQDFSAAIESALAAGRRQGTFLQVISSRVMTMLAAEEIRAAPLKGPQLSEIVYGDPGRRLSSDIDLLIAPEQLQAAVEVVRQMGYGAPEDPIERNGLPILHYALVHERSELPPVELHWRIHWYEDDFARERLLPSQQQPVGTWRPSLPDELTALLLFYARDGFIDLRLAADLGAWWDIYRPELPPAALDEVLRLYPSLSHAVRVAARVAEGTVGISASLLISDLERSTVRDRVAARMANPHPNSSQAQLYAEKGLVDGLLTPTRDLDGFIRRELLPPRAVREVQARHARRQHTRSIIGRAVGILGRYAFTLARLVRRPETLPFDANTRPTA